MAQTTRMEARLQQQLPPPLQQVPPRERELKSVIRVWDQIQLCHQPTAITTTTKKAALGNGRRSLVWTHSSRRLQARRTTAIATLFQTAVSQIAKTSGAIQHLSSGRERMEPRCSVDKSSTTLRCMRRLG